MITNVLCNLDHDHRIDTDEIDEEARCLFSYGQCFALAIGIHALLNQGIAVAFDGDDVLHCYGVRGNEWIDRSTTTTTSLSHRGTTTPSMTSETLGSLCKTNHTNTSRASSIRLNIATDAITRSYFVTASSRPITKERPRHD